MERWGGVEGAGGIRRSRRKEGDEEERLRSSGKKKGREWILPPRGE
jgi:hypothetical protein